MKNYGTVDEYIANFSGETQKRLKIIRKTIKDILPPEATEKISYGIPTFYLNGNLVHFAGFKDHISLFPGSGPVASLAQELSAYKTSKGTIQLPLDKQLPLELITKVMKACVARNQIKK
jgi:uncharacterized protein YdhG (YjbR/CyaY superfamily)